MHIPRSVLYVLILLCIFIFSCVGPSVEIKEDTYYDFSAKKAEKNYLLGSGDLVEITYFFSTQPSEKEYVLEVGDVIDVDFFYHPETNKRATIRPDGKITLIRKGDIHAAGLTPLELKKKIADLYSDTFKNPELTIELIEFSQALRGFKEAISSDRGGHSKPMLIRPDGYISPYYIDQDIKATGLTLFQLKQIIAKEYEKSFSSVDISLALSTTNSNRVFVSGEVRKPDSYQLIGPTTVTQVLSQAGIIFESAALENVLVVSRSTDGRPVGRLVNLEKIFEQGNIGQDIILKRFDIVFVPKTKIVKVNQFIEQYINNIIPDVIRMSFTYRLDQK